MWRPDDISNRKCLQREKTDMFTERGKREELRRVGKSLSRVYNRKQSFAGQNMHRFLERIRTRLTASDTTTSSSTNNHATVWFSHNDRSTSDVSCRENGQKEWAVIMLSDKLRIWTSPHLPVMLLVKRGQGITIVSKKVRRSIVIWAGIIGPMKTGLIKSLLRLNADVFTETPRQTRSPPSFGGWGQLTLPSGCLCVPYCRVDDGPTPRQPDRRPRGLAWQLAHLSATCFYWPSPSNY